MKMLKLWVDTDCNILRIWGGGVYEDHAASRDRHGIMVWQDFAMACAHPIDEAFGRHPKEAEAVVTKLRNHLPSSCERR